MQIAKPEGDKEWRHICTKCTYVDYFNPKTVVGCIVEHPGPGKDKGKLLLCRRAIEPCKGLWTVPAGYQELNESTAEGAARETLEEANARVNVIAPFAHWDIPAIGQAYILFRAMLSDPVHFSPGPESLETELFAPEDIPFNEIAFSSVAISLKLYVEDMHSGQLRMHHGVIDKQPGSCPNDPSTYRLKDHMAFTVTASESLPAASHE